jgi:hypothetical protein
MLSTVSVHLAYRTVYSAAALAGRLKDAHAPLDGAVLAAYGFSRKKDLLAQVLALNLDVASRLSASQSVTAPGVPTCYPEPTRLVTDDCIRAE